MGSRSRSKSKSKRAAESVEASEEPVLEPKVVEEAEEVQQNASALADGFAQSAAFFGKKAAYASAAPVEEKEGNADAVKAKATASSDRKKTKKDRKKKKAKKSQAAEEETAEEEQEEEPQQEVEDDTEEAEGSDIEAAETSKKDKKKRKKAAKKQAEEGDEAEQTPENEQEAPEGDEKARRTVFVGNVSLDATQKDLQRHFSVCGKVENVRLRYLPIAGCAVDQPGNQKLMMKVCANKKILNAAKDNCNAYVTFVDESSVDAALKLSGSTLMLKKIRVDRSEPVMDPRRSVFVGNVPFHCTDEQMLLFFTKRLKTEDEPQPVENVRLIRDRESGLGKGFGYILLKNPSLAAKALALRETKMETRELRVMVCGKRFKNKRGEEDAKEKHEGLRASAGARARIQLKRKTGPDAATSGVTTKKMKLTAAAAGLGKKLKPKHAARKAAQAAAEGTTGAKPTKKRVRGKSDAKAAKPKVKKPKHAARKARQAAEKAKQ
ncbi:hypothetical protein BBJ28_00020670 [Nothophytophthora sp. Chile5]|nr:hypothetical protein BBJ28_00020670 [Nothophytophthora sp. Chile5]